MHLHRWKKMAADANHTRRCQALSGIISLLGLNRRLRSCAVVGGSGILQKHPRGAEIDAHEAVIRVNNCPAAKFESLVGSRTSVRFLNGPISSMNRWAKVSELPKELLHNDHLVVWGNEQTIKRLSTWLPRNASILRANTRFRRQCVTKMFWSTEELSRHRKANHVQRLEVTWGFEAAVHALYACEQVSLYGFYLDPTDAAHQTNAAASGKAMRTPYHYWENSTYDASASDPWRPWTYRYHNFELEHQKLRQLSASCWLRLRIDEP